MKDIQKLMRHVFFEVRQWMGRVGLHGYLVPTTDEHLSEYTPLCARRLEWLTGFSGSLGLLLILRDQAALLVDGRYTLQAQQQVDRGLIEPIMLNQEALSAWIAACAPGGMIGYNPWTLSESMVSFVQKSCVQGGWSLRPESYAIIDHLWDQRPSLPHTPLRLHALEYAGEGSLEKRNRLWSGIDGAVHAVVSSDLCSLAWLLNLRASDVPYTPVAQMYGILHRDGWIDVFISLQDREILFSLEDIPRVRWHPYASFSAHLNQVASQELVLQIDPGTCPIAMIQQCQNKKASLAFKQDPCLILKACKNPIELEGAKQAHLRDGVALVRFLAWLDRTIAHRAVDELQAVEQLEFFRQQGALYQGPSFSTIAASGDHSAVIHYTPTVQTNRPLAHDALFLLDSGGQYLDGTTDVTRTIAFSVPPLEQRFHFTHVLKGHIALARAFFPEGTQGSRLDSLARHHVWHTGWDYEHGTGHGVGSYLSVHEGPHGISSRPSSVGLKEGMLVSNEPGLYKPHAYGIRIENIMAVERAKIDILEQDRRYTPQMLAFQTLTLVPIDLKCIENDLLTYEERAWLDAYHQHVRESLMPYLNPEDRLWIEKATAPII